MAARLHANIAKSGTPFRGSRRPSLGTLPWAQRQQERSLRTGPNKRARANNDMYCMDHARQNCVWRGSGGSGTNATRQHQWSWLLPGGRGHRPSWAEGQYNSRHATADLVHSLVRRAMEASTSRPRATARLSNDWWLVLAAPPAPHHLLQSFLHRSSPLTAPCHTPDITYVLQQPTSSDRT